MPGERDKGNLFFEMKTETRVIFILGPTGAGKTAVGLELAGLLSCEFVSCDSMQLYRGMDIMTDKIDRHHIKKYRYHLLNILSPGANYDVARYVKTAAVVVRKIQSRGRVPVVIGGTGLYASCLLDGIFDGPGASFKIRQHLADRLKKDGARALYSDLLAKDPEAASKIEPADTRRIVRALEFFERTGQKISKQRLSRKSPLLGCEIFLFGIERPRQELYERIERRVDEMVRKGLVEEVRGLLKQRLSQTASQCIGLKEIGAYLRGECELPRSLEEMKKNSRHYAKRQLTWFRRMKEVEWIEMGPSFTEKDAARYICDRVKI